MRRAIRPLVLLPMLLVNGGCQATKEALLSCLYDFSAEVTGGPDAGTELTGELALTAEEDGTMSAEMSNANAEGVDVDAVVEDGTITLTFTVPALGDIVGTGSFDAESCLDSIEGELVGPADGDTGDWAGTLIEG